MEKSSSGRAGRKRRGEGAEEDGPRKRRGDDGVGADAARKRRGDDGAGADAARKRRGDDGAPEAEATRELAVVLNDIAWLLPRTLGRAAPPDDDLPASELEVMRLLVRRPGLSVNEVAAELAMRPSNVSGTVRALIAQGLLERRRDEGDGRVARLHPTGRAIANRDRREDAWGDALTRHLDRLPAGERKRVLAAGGPLRRLAEALGNAGEPS